MSVSEWHANIKTWALMTVKWTNDKVPIHSALQLDCNRKYNNKKWISYLHYHFHLGFFGNRIKSHFISATSTLRESVLPPASACRARKKLSAVIDLLAPNLILIQIFTYLQEACKHTLGVIYFAVGLTHCNALICLLSPKQREGENKEDAVRLPDTWTPPLVSLYRSCWSQTDAKAETSEVYKVGLRSSGACGQKCKARRIYACMSVREWPRSLWSLKRWFEDDWTSLLATPRHFSFHSWDHLHLRTKGSSDATGFFTEEAFRTKGETSSSSQERSPDPNSNKSQSKETDARNTDAEVRGESLELIGSTVREMGVWWRNRRTESRL